MNWILCSERLPEPGVDVLVSNGSKILMASRIDINSFLLPVSGWIPSGITGSPEDYEWDFWTSEGQVKITHWMPLPELPDNKENPK